MRKIIHFIGMRRSGNHAIIRWMQANAFPLEEGTAIHLNNVYSAYAAPGKSLQHQDLSIVSSSKNLLIIFSYEDLPLYLIPTLPSVVDEDLFVEDAIIKNYLLLRDPFNTFASRLQQLRIAERMGVIIDIKKQSWPDIITLWKSYAREYLGLTDIIKNKIILNYNRWLIYKEYRDKILIEDFWAKENLDIGIDEVSPHGGGSSFDGLLYAKRATKMNTQERWRSFLQDEFYRSLFMDKELRDLSQEIFGHISGTETI